MRVRSWQDFFAGMLFSAIGLLGIAMARKYTFGTATEMGPGYMPILLCSGTLLLGLIILGRSLFIGEREATTVGWRPLLFILGSIVTFGATIERFGLVLAVIATVIVGGFAGREIKPLELAALAIGMATFCVAVFVWGLGQPLSIWPR
jgi:hypothetical protein